MSYIMTDVKFFLLLRLLLTNSYYHIIICIYHSFFVIYTTFLLQFLLAEVKGNKNCDAMHNARDFLMILEKGRREAKHRFAAGGVIIFVHREKNTELFLFYCYCHIMPFKTCSKKGRII